MKYIIFLFIILGIIGGIYLALFSTNHKPTFEKPSIDQKKSDFDRYIQQEDSRTIYELEVNKDKG